MNASQNTVTVLSTLEPDINARTVASKDAPSAPSAIFSMAKKPSTSVVVSVPPMPSNSTVTPSIGCFVTELTTVPMMVAFPHTVSTSTGPPGLNAGHRLEPCSLKFRMVCCHL